MTPQDIEPIVRAEAEKMGLGESYEAYGFEGNLEDEIFAQVFFELKRRHPRILREIIRGELDFFLMPVEDENE